MIQYLSDNSREVLDGLGRNVIPPPAKEPLWKQYLKKFKDPLIVVLLVVFAFSVGVSVYEVSRGASLDVLFEPAGVLMALLLATGVGFIFEVRADKEFDILNQTNDAGMIKVLRRPSPEEEPRLIEVERQNVVVGDIVRLESGDEVPADGVLVESDRLKVDESSFTGEPVAEKSHRPEDDDPEATYPTNRLLRGCTIMEGMALMLVTAVGVETEEGHGAMQVREGKTVETPLNKQLGKLGRQVSTMSFFVAVCILIGRVSLLLFDHVDTTGWGTVNYVEYILASVMIAVTLIVVAVPEGLPMSITMSLALSMRRMLKENNLVRKLHACETMGAATVICTDKTGTLTQNKMSVVDHKSLDDELLRLCCAVNSTAEISIDAEGREQALGNPTECALLRWLQSQGIDYRPLRRDAVIVAREQFSSEKKYMSTTLQYGDRKLTLYKGAPEILLAKCVETSDFDGLRASLQEWQSKAMRTLAFAASYEDEPLQVLGVVGIMDSLRVDVKDAIETCTVRAGVRVIIVTGDTLGTACEIGRQIGLLEEGEGEGMVITGPEWAALNEEDALELLPNLKIISRARPDDKARLVKLLQLQGHVVAVTGDGTNDAPALSKAQVGLSMGDGTAHAKEASDITIMDNSFASIDKAILWGRSLYQNIRRFLLFQLTINVSACLIVLIGAFTGQQSPLGVTQMLWVNLIMDTFAAMALSSLPPDPKVMFDKPRSPWAKIIDKDMGAHIVGGGLIMFSLLAAYWMYLNVTPMNLHKLGMFFSTFVLLQFWNLFNARYFHTNRGLLLDMYDTVRHPKRFNKHFSWGFVLILLAIFFGQIIIVQWGYEFFGVEPLTAMEWVYIILGTSLFMVLPEIWRTVRHFLSKK